MISELGFPIVECGPNGYKGPKGLFCGANKWACGEVVTVREEGYNDYEAFLVECVGEDSKHGYYHLRAGMFPSEHNIEYWRKYNARLQDHKE